MGQEEILKLLKEHKGEWFSYKELIILSDCSPSSISISLKKLLNYDMIEDQSFISKTGHQQRKVRFNKW